MLLDPTEAPASLDGDAETLYFCSRGCRQEYEEEMRDGSDVSV
jgi:YHS domain-containing protein